MNNYLVFNHHSLPYEQAEQAVAAIPEFLRICVRAQRLGLNVLFVDESVDASWFRIRLADGFFWQDWYNQNRNNAGMMDLVRAFRSIATRQPFFSDTDIDQQVDLFDIILVSDSQRYGALRAAAWHDAPLVSFSAKAPWNFTPLTIVEESLDEQGVIHQTMSELLNLYSQNILDEVEPFIRNRNATHVRSGRQLFSNWSSLYEHLLYCGNLPEQLTSWSYSPTILEQVKESLNVLNTFAAQWATSLHESYTHQVLRDIGLNHEVSGESSSVLNNPSLRKHREFWLPTGEKVLFENHIKLSKGVRIHFLCESSNRRVYVGYIGSHLPL